jgi:hypothetical protein
MSDHETFYAAVLSAGAILTGFSGTFLQFRIQREANYYRQPVLSYVEGARAGKAQDTYISLTHFTAAFLLIIMATLTALAFGFVFPLLALAEMSPQFVSPRFVTFGLLSALFPLLGYFLTELFHYRILSMGLMNDITEWRQEWPVVVVAIAAAVVCCVWGIR